MAVFNVCNHVQCSMFLSMTDLSLKARLGGKGIWFLFGFGFGLNQEEFVIHTRNFDFELLRDKNV